MYRLTAQTSLRSALRAPLLALTAGLVVVCALGAAPASAIGILVGNGNSHVPMNLVNHRVEVEVTERGAQTKVTQEFENPTGRQLEATYLFPLPKNASIDSFALWMNGKKVTGKVMERKEARRIYESIVRRARDPGLIEYVDAQLFQARVFPVPAKGRQKIELVYSHLVDYEGGTHKYTYPMKTDARASSTLDDFTLTVRVKSKLAIKNLMSPTHKVASRMKANTGVVSMESRGFSLDEDFTLVWSVDDKDVGLTLLSYQDGEEPGYFMLLASPKDNLRDKEIIGKRVSFVVDTSGSMAGEKMDSMRSALKYCIKNLGHDDLFNIVAFGGFAETFGDKMVAASSGEKAKALKFVDQMEPLGGTNIDEAMELTFKSVSGSKKAPHMVVFLTDGRPTVGETDTGALLKRIADANKDAARVFVFGVGDDVNTVLLDKMAQSHGGYATYTGGDKSLEGDVKQFYDKVSYPVLRNLTLRIDGLRTFGTLPRKLPDLFKGGQLVVLGRYRDGGDANVTLTGNMKQGAHAFAYTANFAKRDTTHSFIPRLWAQRQVGMLLAEVREKGETKALVDEITQLATRFGIVTPYTSYLVLEPNAVIPPQGRPMPRVDQPRRRPVGTRPGNFGDGLGGMRTGNGLGLKGEGVGGGGADMEPAEADEDVFLQAPASASPADKGSSGRGALKKKSGKTAVRAAKEIGSLQRSTEQKRRVATSAVKAAGTTFNLVKGVFVDARTRKKDASISIKPYSSAYFEVLRLRPDLKNALLLGEQVVVQVSKGKALRVVSGGKEKIDTKKLAAFLR